MPFLHPSSFFPSSTLLPNSLPPSSKLWRGSRNRCCHLSVSHCLHHFFLLVLLPHSNTVSLPRDTFLHDLLQHGSLPQATVLTQTAPAWVPSIGCSPSGIDCSSMGPPWGHKLCQKTCPSTGSPWGHSLLWATLCFLVLPRLQVGPSQTSMGCRGTAATSWSTQQTAGESLLHQLGHLLPLFAHWPCCALGCSPHISSLLSPAAITPLQ